VAKKPTGKPDLNDPEIVKALKLLEDKGVIPPPKKIYVKKTIDIEKDLYPQVNIRRMELDRTMRQVVGEALRLWLKHNPKPLA
jgi:hypothetical protein